MVDRRFDARVSGLMLASIACAISSAPAVAQSYRDALVEVVNALNSRFVCPQFLPSDGEREREIEHFSQALAEIGVTYADAVEIRRAILLRHHCIPKAGYGT